MVIALSRRLLHAALLLLALSVFSFSLLHLLPGDFAELLLIEQMDGDLPDQATLDRFKATHGFDQPLWQQYSIWLERALLGNLGLSFRTEDPVAEELTLRLAATAQLAAAGLAIGVLLGAGLGVAAAVRPGSLVDHAAMGLAVVGMALPNFWVGLLAILFFSVTLGWLPVAGYGHLANLVLPAVVIGTSLAGVIARLVRACLLEEFGADYVRTANAKGASRSRVIWRHAVPNALVPMVALIGLQVCKLFDGVVVVETVFAWPGIGRLLVESVLGRDFPVIQGCVLLIGGISVLTALVADCLVMAIDPRIRGAV